MANKQKAGASFDEIIQKGEDMILRLAKDAG